MKTIILICVLTITGTLFSLRQVSTHNTLTGEDVKSANFNEVKSDESSDTKKPATGTPKILFLINNETNHNRLLWWNYQGSKPGQIC